MSKTYSLGKIPTWNGVPMLPGLPLTEGNYWFVDAGIGSDNYSGKSMKEAFATAEKAYSVAVDNGNDVICLVGSGSHNLSAMISCSKNRVHFYGMDGTLRRYGQGAKIVLPVTTAAADIGAINNTGVRNSFTNIKFISNNTVAESLYTVLDGGEYTVWEFCEFYKSTDLDGTGAAEFVMNGDSSQVRSCTIGSNADALSGDIVRANMLLTKGLSAAGKVSRDVLIEDTDFWRKASHVNNRYIYGAGATDIERMFQVKNCGFFNTKLAGAVPAQCLALGSEQTQGFAWMRNCDSINNTKLSTTTGVYINGTVPTYATSGIAVSS